MIDIVFCSFLSINKGESSKEKAGHTVITHCCFSPLSPAVTYPFLNSKEALSTHIL